MKDKTNSLDIMLSFSRQLTTKGLFGLLWMTALLTIIGWGFVALFTQLIYGHGVTGMRDNVVWGMYIANFIFFMGLSYAGAIFSGLLILFRVDWRAPIIRIAQLTSVLTGIIGPLYILLCIGRLDRVHFLLTYGRIQSPIFWDILAVTTYLVGNIAFLYYILVPDFAVLRDTQVLRLSNWRKKLYTFLAMGYSGTEEQQVELRKLIDVMAGIIIPVAIVLATILSWIFGLTLRPGWNSTIFGPYFVFASLYSGCALIIILAIVFRKRYNLKEFITDRHFNNLRIAFIVLAFAYGYFTFSEYFTIWYSFQKWDSELIVKLFDFKQYGWDFIISNYLGILFPLILVGIPWFRSNNTLLIAAIIAVVSLWLKRYMIVVPTLETPLLPVQDIRPEFVKYTATWVEWALTFSGVALFLFLYTMITKVVPIIQLGKSVFRPRKRLQGDDEINNS